MGTYTTNKNLFMPTVGETGWGELVNGNFTTIDTFLKPISLSGSTYTFTGNHVGNQSGGSVSATSITNSGTSTFTGKITANGGIAGTTGTFSGEVKSTKFTRTTNYNVTSSTPQNSLSNSTYTLNYMYVCILPPSNKPYNGTVTLKKQAASSVPIVQYITSLDANTPEEISFSATVSEVKTITLSNANCLYINTQGRIAVGNITLA